MRRRVSVIITAHDAESSIAIPLRAIVAQRLPPDVDMDVIVVDDRSEDDTGRVAADWVTRSGTPLHVLRIDRVVQTNVTARLFALEAAIAASDAPALVVLDDDASIPDDFVARALAQLEHTDIVAFPIRHRPGANSRTARLVASLQDIDAAFYHATACVVSKCGGAPAVCFGGAAFRRSTISAIGGVRALGFTLTEDLAFARAVHAAGGTCAFPRQGGAEVAGQSTVRQLRDRALRVSTSGGRSALAVALALPIATLPIVALLVGAGLVSPWLLGARWLLGATVLSHMARVRGARSPLIAALLYEVAAIALASSVALRLVRYRRIRWGGLTYDLRDSAATPTSDAVA